MSVKTKTVYDYTCDICGKACIPCQQIACCLGGGSKDVGPSYLILSVQVNIPYANGRLHACESCVYKNLRKIIPTE